MPRDGEEVVNISADELARVQETIDMEPPRYDVLYDAFTAAQAETVEILVCSVEFRACVSPGREELKPVEGIY